MCELVFRRSISEAISAYKSVLVPLDTLLLVGVGVRETLNLTSLATEETVKVWSDLVSLALLQVVALRAAGLDCVRRCSGKMRRRCRDADRGTGGG